MAESRARLGYGTLLERRTATSPDVWQLLGERTQIGGPTLSRETPDVTHMDSPGGWREFLGGLKDGGEVTVEGNWVPEDETLNSETGVLSEFGKATRTVWRLTFPSTSDFVTPSPATPRPYWQFEAIMTGFETNEPVDDKMTYSATFKISGEPIMFIP